MPLPERGIKEAAYAFFGVKVGLSEYDGRTPAYVYYPIVNSKNQLLGYKTRFLPHKKFWIVGTGKGAVPFGWFKAKATGGKTLFVTEGEDDACAVWQAIKERSIGTKYADNNPAVISIANGAGSAGPQLASIATEVNQLFQKVVYIPDADGPGKEAIRSVQSVFPDVEIATVPGKDPRDCVLNGKTKALADAVLFRTARPKNTRLINLADIAPLARKPVPMGIPWPWKGLTKLTRGIRFGETIYIGAGVKMGKSEIVNTLAADLVLNQGMKVMLAKPEESNVKTARLLASKVAGKFFHDPNVDFDVAAYDAAIDKLGRNVTMLDLFQDISWETLQADIVEAVQDGCRAVFIDPITNLTNGMNSAEANTKLESIAQQLSVMALSLDIIVFIFCHLKSPDTGLPHERGGAVLSSQFAGSRAMMRKCNMMLALQGNKDDALPVEERNLRDLVILEDREYGQVGRIKLYWDNATGLFNELPA